MPVDVRGPTQRGRIRRFERQSWTPQSQKEKYDGTLLAE